MGIAMPRILDMIRDQNIEDPSRKISPLPPIVNPKFMSTPNCIITVCVSCQISRAKKLSPGVVEQNPVSDKEFILS